MMGVGVDLVDMELFRTQLADPASNFTQRVFHPAELRYARSQASGDPACHLAVRYAAREAFIKAWSSMRWGQTPKVSDVDLHDIEVVQDAFGRPALRLHGTLAELCQGLQTKVSLSHDGGYAVAFVLVQEGDSMQ